TTFMRSREHADAGFIWNGAVWWKWDLSKPALRPTQREPAGTSWSMTGECFLWEASGCAYACAAKGRLGSLAFGRARNFGLFATMRARAQAYGHSSTSA